MKKKLVVFLVIIVLFAGTALAAGQSAGYKMAAEILDAGSTVSTSTSFRLLGKARERQLGAPSSSGFVIGEGFLRSIYFSRIVPVLAPVVTTLSPAAGINTGPVDITGLLGANFQAGASVKLSKSGQADIAATKVVVVNSSQITCTLDITGAAGGLWDVTVINPDGRSGTLASAFKVTYPAPALTSIAPAKGNNDKVVGITDLLGANFRAGASVRLLKAGEGDIIGANVVLTSTKITCQFDLNTRAIGRWDVTVINDDGQQATLKEGFTVESPNLTVTKPVVSSQNPFNPATGPTTITYGLSQSANITIFVYNMRAERVWQWTAAAGEPGGQVGDNQVVWDGLTAFKSFVGEGVYLVHVVSGGKILTTTKIAVIR